MKYTKEEIEVHKKHLTVADMNAIAKKHGMHGRTLRNVLIGVFNYDSGDKKRQAMIKEATELIRERVINDMEVIHKTVNQCTQ